MTTTSTTAPTSPRRLRPRRDSIYPQQYSVCVSYEVGDSLKHLCEQHDMGKGVALRQVIDQGLPPVKDSLASRYKRAARRTRSGEESRGY